MKKTRFFLAAMLLVTMFAFTGCGNQDDKNNDAIPDNQQNQTMQQDEENAAGDVRDDADKDADDIRNDADDLGDDVKDDVDDAADDVKDALDGDDEVDNHNRNGKDQTGENMGQ